MTVEIQNLPGYHVRRLHQIAVAMFFEETKAQGLTPVQYGALAAVAVQPGTDQRRLARAIGIDTSTIASVVDRLEARGLMARNASPDDRRVRLLTLSKEGERLVSEIEPSILRIQERILAPLPVAQRDQFVAMLRTLVEGNTTGSSASSESKRSMGG
ncbi:MarR family winged helix-turn-helix transcriptional regulator [Variovorax sp. E3]|uniref:MarR family winged helix-turn-helix transcriptional regulator n=1 Tax=Variovorax sp. E3 TaxID=1914993 RepID=UPI0018DBB2A8|nr:MarR family transcriptional regulator [Variovorax sp. E3]